MQTRGGKAADKVACIIRSVIAHRKVAGPGTGAWDLLNTIGLDDEDARLDSSAVPRKAAVPR